MSQTKIRNSVGNFGFLSVCSCRLSFTVAAYTDLCRGLYYLLKVRYIILNFLNVARFLIFETLYLGWSKILSYIWKNYHKNEQHLCLVTHISTKLSHNVCLINKHILIYWYARRNCRLWKVPWFYYVFCLNIFILYWRPFMSELMFLHKISQIVSMDTFWHVRIPNVTAGYGRFSDLICAFFRVFSYIILYLMRYNFIKPLQIVL